MSNHKPKWALSIQPKILAPHQLAWLRRPELDQPGEQIWEKPDGALHAHDPKQGPLKLNFYKMPRGVAPE